MIGKVTRGTDARWLLYYLYGPGKANEHTDPHLVADFGDPAELEPERRPGGSRDLRRLAGLFAQPMAALNGDVMAPSRRSTQLPPRRPGTSSRHTRVGSPRRRIVPPCLR